MRSICSITCSMSMFFSFFVYWIFPPIHSFVDSSFSLLVHSTLFVCYAIVSTSSNVICVRQECFSFVSVYLDFFFAVVFLFTRTLDCHFICYFSLFSPIDIFRWMCALLKYVFVISVIRDRILVAIHQSLCCCYAMFIYDEDKVCFSRLDTVNLIPHTKMQPKCTYIHWKETTG